MINQDENLKFLKLVFPTIYGEGSKSDLHASLLFEKVIEFLQTDQSFFSKSKERKELLSRLTKATPSSDKDSLKIIWKSEYACSVVIRKPKPQSPIDIKIVVPQEWASGVHHWKANNFQHCEPQGQSAYHLPLVVDSHISLDEFYGKFAYKLETEILIKMEKNRNKDKDTDKDKEAPKDPSFIEEACKVAILCYAYTPSDNEKDQKKEKKVATSQIQGLNLDKSQANTCWYVPEATIIDLITRNSPSKDWPAADKLIIGFKGYMLEKVTRQRAENNQYDQMQVANFKRCLDELIERYKKKVSIVEDENINRYKDFKKFIGKINAHLKKITNNGLTSKVNDIAEKPGSLKFEEPKTATINLPQNEHHLPQEIVPVQIDEYPLKVEKRLLFQKLLEIGDGIEKKDFVEKDKWVLLTQRTLFSLTEEFNTDKKIIDLNIHMREIECELNASNLCLLVQKYEKIHTLDQKHKKHFGNNMNGQNKSHIELIKTIGSIVAFESVKMNRQQRESNLNDYRVPLSIDALFKGFVSHSYEARRAMKNVLKYHESRKNKQQLFVLDGTSDSFAKFARLVARQTRSAKVWKDNMKKTLKLKQDNAFKDIKLDEAAKRIQSLVAQIQQPQQRGLFFARTKHENQTYNSYISSVFAQYDQSDPQLFAFLENIPSDVLGMMKIFYLAQNPSEDQEEEESNIFSSHFEEEKFRINFCCIEPNLDSILINSGNIKAQQIPVAKFFEDVNVLFNNCSYGNEIEPSYFEDYRKVFSNESQAKEYQEKLNYIMNRPDDLKIKNREHRLYAKQNQKPTDLELQDFLAVGNIRSAQNTQLMVLCFNILERKLISNSYNQGCLLAEETFLQTAGQLSTYVPEVEQQFKQIRKLITEFIKIWAFTDATFCPTFGPFMGFISRTLIDDDIPDPQELQAIRKITFKLCLKCLEEYQRGQAELKSKPNEKIQWYQRFTLTAAVTTLRQTILTPEDEEETIMLCNIIFALRSTQILSGRQEKPSDMRPFHEQLAFSISKTVYYNIQTISNLLTSKPQHIADIIKKMDPSYQQDVAWSRKNLFSFFGNSEKNDDIYQIDLYLGKIFKNGKEISALDPKIKQKQSFIKIFGPDRQFQVFQSHNPHFLRTKNSLNHQFKIPQTKGLVFFEFSQDGNQIRHIFRKKGESTKDEEIWVLLKKQNLTKSNCFFPKLFLDQYQAWFSQKRKCIMFRKTKFEDLYHAGVVIHLQTSGGTMKIDKAFYITYHGSFENQDLDELCDKNTQKYPEIILRSKDDKPQNVNCFKLLSRFEGPEYILELKNGNKIEYYLHRYQSKFWLEDETRLSSESYFGYSLDYSFYENNASIFNKFPCLVLRKHSKNQTLLNSHKRIVVISEGEVKYGGKIKKIDKADRQISSFKYEIHDFFGDLRGATRQSLLHLSAIMLSINDNMKVTSIEMTPLDYSIHLLKSCLSNRPYSAKDIQKMQTIVSNLNPPESYVLLLECLWQCSSALTDILPFRQKKVRSVFYDLKQKELMTCRDMYQKKLGKDTVRYRQKISYDLLNYIGMSLTEEGIYATSDNSQSSKSSPESSSQSDDSDSGIKHKKYWKNLKEFTGKKQESNFKQIKRKFQNFNKTANDVCKIWKQQNPNKSSKKNILSTKIKKLVQNPECNPMTKQMIVQLENSYDIFLKQEDRIQIIIKNLTGNKKSQIQTIKQLIDNGSSLVQEIESIIEDIKYKNQQHPDAITGIKPTLSQICFTHILCDPTNLKHFFPWLKSSAHAGLVETIKIWVQLKTRLASFERIIVLLESQTLDAIALMREAESPRDQVRKKNHWLCFQAQNKVQLWSSQLDTYNNLTSSGDFCQLNMGEGKTQVIIPMMILDAIYEKKNCLPRINLLSSLIDEARGNFFRFLSVTSFQIPGFEIPFTRQVDLWSGYKKNRNILTVQNLINSFSNRLYILQTRESRLSQILRFYQVNKQNKNVSIKSCPLIPPNIKIFDIFDEIDELMNPIKSYIFSIGNTVDLPSSKERFEIMRVLVEVFLTMHLKPLFKKNMVISQETFEQTLKFVEKGNYPPGLRLSIQHSQPQDIMKFKRSLAKNVILQLKSTYFSFFKKLSKQQKKYILDYITNPLDANLKFPNYVEKTWRIQILVLRGALGYGIFEHCLSMRCGVNYGVPNKEHKKRIAVPYDAADIPSKTSEYQHPDVSIFLSYFAYYTKGLTLEQFLQALKKLLALSSTCKTLEYQSWFDSLSSEHQDQINVKNAQQINLNSKVVVNQLYHFYRRNRKAIAFWLNVCIFPSNLRQYNQSISASAWDLADVENSVGFSGTKDNHWLYSNKLNWKPCETPSISGTDGKMIHLITKNTVKICLIQQNDNNQWQRFVNEALSQKVDCIIDAGALCVGKSLERQIVPWISEHELFNRKKFAGISFCDENGKWKVYDVESKYYIARGTSIPDHETFVIFDEARTRGADLKMNGDVVAAISLGPEMTKDKFMQAAGRLRKLGRNQKLIIMATHQIFSSLPEFNNVKDILKKIKNSSIEDLSNSILAWCCKNSIELNEKLLIQYANLGWDYVRSKEDAQIYIKGIRDNNNDKEFPKNLSDLDRMYEHGLQKTTVAKLNQKITNQLDNKYLKTLSGEKINKILSTYGKNVHRQAGSLDDVCERQVEPQPEVQKEEQDAVVDLEPIEEVDNPEELINIKGVSVVFDCKFRMTGNFTKTTKENIPSFAFSIEKPKELSELYFVLYDSSSIKAITLREASLYIKKHIIDKNPTNKKLQILGNLSIQDDFIKKNQLQSALVSAKFLSGVQNFTEPQQDYLLKILLNSIQANPNWRENYQNLTSVILRKKRVYLKKYFGSTLEKMVTRLKNQDIDGYNPDENEGFKPLEESDDESDFESEDEMQQTN